MTQTDQQWLDNYRKLPNLVPAVTKNVDTTGESGKSAATQQEEAMAEMRENERYKALIELAKRKEETREPWE